MFRTASCVLAGPLVWLAGYGVGILTVTFFWGMGADTWISTAIMAYVSSLFAAVLAFAAMEKIEAQLSPTLRYAVVATFILLWVGIGVLVAADDAEASFQVVSLRSSPGWCALRVYRLWQGSCRRKALTCLRSE